MKGIKEKDAFYTVAYDLPSEYLSICIANASDDETTKEKKAKTRSMIGKVRHSVRNGILKYGRFVNNSVFIIPQCDIEDVKHVVNKAKADYVELNKKIFEEYGTYLEYDITTLAFDSSESVKLRWKAKEALMQELNKSCDKLDKRINKLSTNGSGTTKRSIQTAHNGLSEVEGIIAKFKLDAVPEIQAMVEQVRLKIQDLDKLTTTTA